MKPLRAVCFFLLVGGLLAACFAFPTSAQVGLSASLACAFVIGMGVLVQGKRIN
ncbi:MAG: hypothetical protein IH586_03625 [Anaerolineaceae bacterium]|nr:hypothetical protein [Anaerolineaceae bacterium]